MSKTGRPTKVTPDVLRKLEEAFALGCSDVEACFFAGLPKSTFYDYQQVHPEFSERKEVLKSRPVLLARQSVLRGLQEDATLALRFLERVKKDEFSLRQEITGKNGEKPAGVVIYMPEEGKDTK